MIWKDVPVARGSFTASERRLDWQAVLALLVLLFLVLGAISTCAGQ